MKKKWIALKRRWKKLSPFDRRFYRVQAIVIAFNLLTLPFTWTAICSLLWVGLLTYVYSMELRSRRVEQYIYYYKGRWRQLGLDNKECLEAAAIKSEYSRLCYNYNKLKYECNQLKKSFCDIQNKKNINPKNNEKWITK
jgi:hypothetical protein